MLILPKSFVNGGYVFSPLCIAASSALTTYCAVKLVQAGLQTRLMSYSLIGQRALGSQARKLIDVMLMLTQFSFTISQITFVTQSLNSVLNFSLALNVDTFNIAVGVIIVYTLLAWVRKIEKFSLAFIFGNFFILLSCTVIIIYCAKIIDERGPGEGFIPMNYSLYWSMVGFSVYCYEGIGVVMPIMATCACPEKFPKLLAIAVGILTVFYITFAEFCYYTFGSGMNQPIVMSMMPSDSAVI